jgi:DNA-binding transcriptional regulator GbsR (MarR family)
VLTKLKQKFSDGITHSYGLGGNSHLAGQLCALLMFSTKPLSLQEMAEQLGVTKAAISLRIRILEEQGMCYKTSKLSDRKDYYQLADNIDWVMLEHGLISLQRLSGFINEVLAEWPTDLPDEMKEEERLIKYRFMKIKLLCELLFERLEGLDEEWEKRKQQLVKEYLNGSEEDGLKTE